MLHTTGFVLRKNDYREYDRIYTVYTSDFGKMSLLVRGAKKIKSKLSPALENFDKIRIDFAKGKFFNHLSGSAAGAENKNIFCDAEKIFLSRDCLYLIDRFIKPEESDLRIFNLIDETLDAIARDFFSPCTTKGYPAFFSPLDTPRGELEGGFCPPPNLPLRRRGIEEDLFNIFQKIKIYFFWKLIEYLGYEPRLDECALCGHSSRVIPAETGIQFITKFNITDNIIICGNCVGEGIKIEEKTLENLRKIFGSDLAGFLKTDLDASLSAITEKARQIKLSEL